MEHIDEPQLRDEISFLGKILGETIRDYAGKEAFEIVEELRKLAWDRRIDRPGAENRMTERIAALDTESIRVVTRAFTVFLDLLNLVEDRHRVRVLNSRSRKAYPGPRRESIRDAISTLKNAGKTTAEVQELLDDLHIELVFTAHPTDAKRRSVRSKLTAIRELMSKRDAAPLPEELEAIQNEIRAEVARLWETDFIRPWRPTVMQEVARGLSIKPVLWKELPKIASELRQAVQESYPKAKVKRPCVTFGSWIGGDRDGHPGVTAGITAETSGWLRREAIEFHTNTCERLFHSMSLSTRQVTLGAKIEETLAEAVATFPELVDRLSSLPPGETLRRWLSVMHWRLENTAAESIGNSAGEDGLNKTYANECELISDLDVLIESLEGTPAAGHASADLHTWRSQIETFGFHLAKLDLRQNAKVYSEVLKECLAKLGLCEDWDEASEADRVRILQESIGTSLSLTENDLAPMTQETLSTFRTLHQIRGQFSPTAIGASVISMTAAPSDVLAVLWLWSVTSPAQSEAGANAPSGAPTGPPIAPLLETIEDLQAGPAILEGMLQIPVYRDYVRSQGDKQVIMLGYSDSTKDGGYLAACWSLYLAQQDLVKVADRHGLKLTFFHGRGGSLGRGGGPAARSILSLPQGTFQGALRLTEQGEVLADRYDDADIAHRHLEQVVWSSILSGSNSAKAPAPEWLALMSDLSESSFQHYRQLLEQPGFVPFFRQVTPISDIEQLPIGSRPSRRKPDGGLSDLRAIPWVFSWTQSRCLLPAWYGMGKALSEKLEDDASRELLCEMYKEWPFFRALIDNAELALAKSDMKIAKHYAQLVGESASHQSLAEQISLEFKAACWAVLAMTNRGALLDGIPWLKESIRVRNRFVDPLNLIQVELLRRSRNEELAKTQTEEQAEELRHLTRLSINGVAAGMRTSG